MSGYRSVQEMYGSRFAHVREAARFIDESDGTIYDAIRVGQASESRWKIPAVWFLGQFGLPES